MNFHYLLLSPDYFDKIFYIVQNYQLGICGHKIHGRDKYLNLFLNSNIMK